MICYRQVPQKWTTPWHGLNHTISSTRLQNFPLQLSDISNYLTRLIFKLLPKSPTALISQKKARVHLTCQNTILLGQRQHQDLATTLHRKAWCPFFTSMDCSSPLVLSSPVVTARDQLGFRGQSGCLLQRVTRFQRRLQSSGRNCQAFLKLQHCSKDSPVHSSASFLEREQRIKTQQHFHVTNQPTGHPPGFHHLFLKLAPHSIWAPKHSFLCNPPCHTKFSCFCTFCSSAQDLYPARGICLATFS